MNGFNGRLSLVRRQSGWYKYHPIEPEFLVAVNREQQVPEMDGVKGAPE